MTQIINPIEVTEVVLCGEGTTVVVDDQDPVVVTEGEQGPPGPRGQQGPPGPAGGSTLIKTAGEAIGGQRVVMASGPDDVLHADPTNPATAVLILGISANAAAPGDDVGVVRQGEIVENTWSWIPGLPIVCGLGGVLTQSVPALAVYTQPVGVALTATKIFVNIGLPIARN